MSTPYVVKAGDWLQKIAEEHGFESWRDIYYHEDNAEFRRQRPDPDKIYPGDVVMIPDRTPGTTPPGTTPPGGQKTVIAEEGDTFCSIAAQEGFPDCAKLRAEPANAAIASRQLQPGDVVTIPALEEGLENGETEKLHEFVRDGVPIASVRFVHGTPNRAFKDDPTLDELDVSNYRPDLAGTNRTRPFAKDDVRTFDADAHADEDTFKLEVHDLRAKSPNPPVELDLRRPTYDVAGKLSGHTDFPGTRTDNTTERGQRILDSITEEMQDSRRFRTCYLKLVIDAEDKAARPTQTLLATHMVDATPADEQVEILDQVVVGTYRVEGCPAATDDAKCRAKKEIPLCRESRQRRTRLCVNVLRTSRTGAGVITLDQARKACLRTVRELFAQAHLSVKMVATERLVPPPSNLFAIADGNGRNSLGGRKMKVRVRIDATIDKTVEIDTVAGRPIVNAKKLRDAIAAAVGAGVAVKESENPRIIGQAIGSADVLVGNPLTQRVRLNIVTNGDARHPLSIGRTTSTRLATEFDGNDSHVGTVHERVLVKNYDSGTNRIDLIVVNLFPTGSRTLGEAFTPNFGPLASRRPIATMVNSVIVLARPFANRNTFHTVVPHELGHILMDANHVAESTEMMFDTVTQNARAIDSTKRISDPANVTQHLSFDDGKRGNPVDMIRTSNATLLDAW